MIKSNVAPFEKEQLIEGLKTAFPNYKVQSGLGGLQVRTSGFTVTGNVQVKIKPKKGEIITQTNYDMRVVFLLFFFPMGVYIFMKKDKQIAMEKEVADRINEILG
ncbi:MAG: hypothetical protein AB8B59_11305 [Maribacter sp.]